MRAISLVSVAAAGTVIFLVGCGELSKVVGSTWHQKCGWKAEDYFDDPQVIALCKAIEADDLEEIDRLVAAGADVNAKGEGKMTPLLWSFFDNKLARFKRLLEHGADPNVVIESDFNTRGAVSAGDSVTHMASKTAFPGYFEAVFEHGGDVNLQLTSRVGLHDTPLFSVIKFGGANKKERIQLLLDKGADINYMNGADATPVMNATSWGGQYGVALALLEKGADHRIYKPRSNTRLIHIVLGEVRRSKAWTSQQRNDYQRLVKWLEDHGESVVVAQADIDRWASWVGTPAQKAKLRRREVAERKAREKAAQQEQEDAPSKP